MEAAGGMVSNNHRAYTKLGTQTAWSQRTLDFSVYLWLAIPCGSVAMVDFTSFEKKQHRTKHKTATLLKK